MNLSHALQEGGCEYEWLYQIPDGKTMIPAEEKLQCIEVDGKKTIIAYTRLLFPS